MRIPFQRLFWRAALRRVILCTITASLCIGIAYGQSYSVVKAVPSVWKMQDSATVGAVSGTLIAGASYNASSWRDAVVPGTVLQTLADSGHLYPDPMYGLSMAASAASPIPDLAAGQKSYWYYTTIPISFPATSGEQQWLCFDGINYMADVYLNGKFLGVFDSTKASIGTGAAAVYRHSMVGAFKRAKFNVTGTAVSGTNYLAVRILPNINPGTILGKEASSCVSVTSTLAQDGPTFIASQGSLWSPTIPDRDMGIWNDVTLKATGPIVLRSPFMRSTMAVPFTAASCTLSVQLRNPTSSAVTGTLHCVVTSPAGSPFSFDSSVTVAPLDTPTITFHPGNKPALNLSSPTLWWPNGYGNPNLYTCAVSCLVGSSLSDSLQFAFGIRQISCDRSSTAGLIFKVNGKRILIKGGNWGIDDAMKRTNRHTLEAKVRLSQAQNLNMIRNYAGMTDDEQFYEVCDKYGMLVWDDFWSVSAADGPSNVAAYIDTNLWLSSAADKIIRWRNHPCIAVWCARDQSAPITALWSGLQERATRLDGTRIIQQSSGTNNAQTAAFQYYSGPDSAFSRVVGFTTNIGSTVIPSYESVAGFIPAANQWPVPTASTPNSSWSFHDFCLGSGSSGNQLFTAAMSSRFGAASNVRDYCALAQLMNYDLYRAFFESLNSRMWNGASGLLLWQSNPAWPSMVWQTYDYFLEGTGAFYGAMHGGEPVHIQYYYSTGSTNSKSVCVANTGSQITNATVNATIYNLAGSKVWDTTATVASIPGDTVASLFRSPAGSLSYPIFLFLTLKNSGGTVLSQNSYLLPASGSASLSNMAKTTLVPSISNTSTGYTVQLWNSGSTVAAFCRLKVVRGSSGVRVLPAYYGDNYFSMAPGEMKGVSLSFDKSDLKGDLPTLVLSGVNVDSIKIPFGSVTTCAASSKTHSSIIASVERGKIVLRNIPAGSAWKVRVFDVRGRMLLDAHGSHEQTAMVPLSRLAPGSYIFEARAAGQAVRSRILRSSE